MFLMRKRFKDCKKINKFDALLTKISRKRIIFSLYIMGSVVLCHFIYVFCYVLFVKFPYKIINKVKLLKQKS